MLIQRRADDGRREVVLYPRNGRGQTVVSHFFAMCRKFGVLWSKASEEQKAFIEEITRINYEREEAKRGMTVKPVRGFFDAEVSA